MIWVDHFCGGGGASTGMLQAADEVGVKVELHAHNHWARAIETHSANHPDAICRQARIEDLNPIECVRGKRVALMWASPECTHHSVARGGRPRSDQSRATAMCVIKWAQELYIDRIIVENVPEFLHWGPIGVDGQPLKSGRGKTFLAWKGMLESLGYRVDWRLLRAADYGDPTTRKRLFVQAARGRKKIIWPDPTHSAEADMWALKPWVPAQDIIDYGIESQSIFARKKPLADATLRRIEHGIKKYWGEWAEPFICVLRGTGTSREIGAPLPAITAGGTHLGLVEPMFVPQHSCGSVKPVSMPLSTVATAGAISLVEPFLSKFHGGSPKRNYSLGDPVPTLDCSNRVGVVEPFIAISRGASKTREIGRPLPTVSCGGIHAGLVEPLLVEYYGNGAVRQVYDPLPTVTCRDRFGVLQGGYLLDIKFRMLQPSELAGAQGFPSDYWFSGTKADQVRQIGNAVCPGVARALTKGILVEDGHG